MNRCKIFARFQSKEDHEKFVNGLLKERLIREAIDQLTYFRSKGLTTLDQVEKYIDTNKLKLKQMAYDTKHYSSKKQQPMLNGQFSEQSLTQVQKLIQQPESKLLNAKELKASSVHKVDLSPLTADSNWSKLGNREKVFVSEINMKPTSYCNIKRTI